MKTIKIFLASSINDLHLERMEIGNFIRSLNDRFVEQGVYFRLCMCEDASDALAQSRKQDEFNDMIRDCDYFFIMFWHKAGAYTVEEFDVALRHFRETNAPKIMTYFKVIEEGDSAEQTVTDFMKRLENEFEHFHSSFTHTDTIKLRLLTVLSEEADTRMRLELRDGKLWVNDVHMTSFYPENLPFYRNHDAISRLRAEAADLEQAAQDARIATINDPANQEKWAEVARISVRQNQLQEELHGYEMQLLETSMRLTRLTADGTYVTPRTKKAIDLFEAGKLTEALAVLDMDAFEADLRRTEAAADTITRQMEALVKELTTRIDILMAQGVTAENAAEIAELYEKAREITLKHGLGLDCVVDYMDFLREQTEHTQAIKIGDQLYHAYKSRVSTDEYEWAGFCNDLGLLYAEYQRSAEAEALYREALAIYRRLAAADPAGYEPDVAITCHNLAMVLTDDPLCDRFSDAEGLYREALDIRRRLAVTHPATYEPDVAMTCNGLACLYTVKRRWDEAEALYQEALAVYRRLAAVNPAWEHTVAMTCHNLAVLYKEHPDILDWDRAYSKAETLYTEALTIYRRLTAINPAAYEPLMARTCTSLANLHSDHNHPAEAERLFCEALTIFRRFAAVNPVAFEPYLAVVCHDFALHRLMSDHEMAVELLEEAFTIARKYKETDRSCSTIYAKYKYRFE